MACSRQTLPLPLPLPLHTHTQGTARRSLRRPAWQKIPWPGISLYRLPAAREVIGKHYKHLNHLQSGLPSAITSLRPEFSPPGGTRQEPPDRADCTVDRQSPSRDTADRENSDKYLQSRPGRETTIRVDDFRQGSSRYPHTFEHSVPAVLSSGNNPAHSRQQRVRLLRGTAEFIDVSPEFTFGYHSRIKSDAADVPRPWKNWITSESREGQTLQAIHLIDPNSKDEWCPGL